VTRKVSACPTPLRPSYDIIELPKSCSLFDLLEKAATSDSQFTGASSGRCFRGRRDLSLLKHSLSASHCPHAVTAKTVSLHERRKSTRIPYFRVLNVMARLPYLINKESKEESSSKKSVSLHVPSVARISTSFLIPYASRIGLCQPQPRLALELSPTPAYVLSDELLAGTDRIARGALLEGPFPEIPALWTFL
jgi:hypothetical protein